MIKITTFNDFISIINLHSQLNSSDVNNVQYIHTYITIHILYRKYLL